MEAKKQIAFLEELLAEESKNLLLAELNYRLANSKILEGKLTENLNFAMTEAGKVKEQAAEKIRHLRGLIKELSDGKYKV